MLIFFKIHSTTYPVELQNNPTVIQVLTAIQENCREYNLPFVFDSFSCMLDSGQYLGPDDLGKLALEAGIFPYSVLKLSFRSQVPVTSVIAQPSIRVPEPAAILPSIVYMILTGFLEEDQIPVVWNFFRLQVTDELIEQLYYPHKLLQVKIDNLEACKKPDELLEKAICQDDVWLLRLAIREGAVLNNGQEDGDDRPINRAIQKNSIKCLKELLKHPEIDTDNKEIYSDAIEQKTDIDGEVVVTPYGHVHEKPVLICAIENLKFECIEVLLSHGVNFGSIDYTGKTALYTALIKLKQLHPEFQKFMTPEEIVSIEKEEAVNLGWGEPPPERLDPKDFTQIINGVAQDPCKYLIRLISVLRAPQMEVPVLSLLNRSPQQQVASRVSLPPIESKVSPFCMWASSVPSSNVMDAAEASNFKRTFHALL